MLLGYTMYVWYANDPIESYGINIVPLSSKTSLNGLKYTTAFENSRQNVAEHAGIPADVSHSII